MYRYMLPAAAIAVALSSSLAFADQSTGVVKTFDAKAMTVTLDNGTIFYLPQKFVDPGLKAGERVQITWTMEMNKHEASAVKIL